MSILSMLDERITDQINIIGASHRRQMSSEKLATAIRTLFNIPMDYFQMLTVPAPNERTTRSATNITGSSNSPDLVTGEAPGSVQDVVRRTELAVYNLIAYLSSFVHSIILNNILLIYL